MKNFFEIKKTITASEVDSRWALRFDSILNIFQDLATSHAREMGMGFDDLMNSSNAFWVLSKIKFNISNKILQFDEVTAKTWPLKPSLIRFQRDFSITASDKAVLGSSEWCILDATNYSLRKLSSVNYPALLQHLEYKANVGDFLRFNYQVEDEDYIYAHKAQYIDIDCNNHVNNVSYAKMALNAFTPQEFIQYGFNGFEIHFVSQSFYGDEIKIYKKPVDLGVYVEGRIEEKIIFKTLFTK